MDILAKKIERQDFVDNAIMDLITELNPSTKKIEWNIDMIATIRDVISTQLVSKGFCTEEQFYP